MKAVGVNISDGGMCLFAVAHFRVGSRIEVEFLSPDSGVPNRIPAVVRHRALYLYGVELLPEAGTNMPQDPAGRNTQPTSF